MVVASISCLKGWNCCVDILRARNQRESFAQRAVEGRTRKRPDQAHTLLGEGSSEHISRGLLDPMAHHHYPVLPNLIVDHRPKPGRQTCGTAVACMNGDWRLHAPSSALQLCATRWLRLRG